jgi:hemoglobin
MRPPSARMIFTSAHIEPTHTVEKRTQPISLVIPSAARNLLFVRRFFDTSRRELQTKLASIVSVDEQEIYSLVGDDGFQRLVAAFYRQVPQDDVLGPMYPAHDLAGAEQRLCDFLIYRFGGPPKYIEERGHPRLRMRHMPFAITQAARDRWMLLMDRAMMEAGLPADAMQPIREFFDGMSAFMINHQ